MSYRCLPHNNGTVKGWKQPKGKVDGVAPASETNVVLTAFDEKLAAALRSNELMGVTMQERVTREYPRHGAFNFTTRVFKRLRSLPSSMTTLPVA